MRFFLPLLILTLFSGCNWFSAPQVVPERSSQSKAKPEQKPAEKPKKPAADEEQPKDEEPPKREEVPPKPKNEKEPSFSDDKPKKPEQPQEPRKAPKNDAKPESNENSIFRITKDKYADIDSQLKKLPLYIALRTDFQGNSFEMKSSTPLEVALKNNDFALVKTIANNVVSILGKNWGQLGNPLSFTIRHNSQKMFELLLPLFKKLYLYEQNQENPLSTALALCDENVDDCKFYLNRMLDSKFNPTSIKDHQALNRAELLAFKERVDAIIDYNRGQNGSALRDLISANCDENKIRKFLNDSRAQVDWISEKSTNKISSLCYLMNNNKCRQNGTQYAVLDLLIKNGASPNCSKEFPILYPLLDVGYIGNSHIFNAFFNRILESGTNPFIPKANKIFALSIMGDGVKKINDKYPHLWNELTLRSNLATILGQEFDTIVFGSPYKLSGGNTQKEVYGILEASLEDFQNEQLPQNLEKAKILQDVSKGNILQKSIKAAVEFLSSSNAENIIEKIYQSAQNFPVIIPATWDGHAVSLVIFKDIFVKLNNGDRSPGIKAGARFYQFSPTKENIKSLLPLLSFSGVKALPEAQGKQLFDYGLDDQMGLKLIGQKEEVDQCIGNCTWESSASFSLQVALALLTAKSQQDLLQNSYGNAKEITEHFKRFASYRLVKKYITHAVATLGSNRCLPDTAILTEILKTEVSKAVLAKSTDYFQDKIIGYILSSGLPLKNFNKKFSQDFGNQLRYLLKKVGLPADNIDQDVADKIYDIYDPRRERMDGRSTYPWGNCFY